MRHRKAGVKLNMSSSHRQAMFRNMVTSLFKHDRIKTTNVRAKELRRWADHIITLAKRGDLHARRQALAIMREKDVVHKLFEEAEKRFGKVSGGYTRITKLGRRPGDAAPISIIELIAAEDKPKKKKKKAKTPKKTAAAVDVAAEKAETEEAPEAVEAAESDQTEEEAGKEEKKASADDDQGSEGEALESAPTEAAEAPDGTAPAADADDAGEPAPEKKED